MKNKILITGANGTVGRETVRWLVQRGIDVRAGVHSLDSAAGLAGEHVEIVQFDWRIPSSIRALVAGIDSAFLITPSSPDQAEWAKSFIDIALFAGMNNIIRLSMFGAISRPGTIQSRQQHEIEHYLRTSNLHFTLLEPTMFMQNFIKFHSVANGFIYLPFGDARVSFIDARDVAEAAGTVLMNPIPHFGQNYSLTGPVAITMDEVAETLTSSLGHLVSYINIPEDTARHILDARGLSSWLVEATLEQQSAARGGRISSVTQEFELITEHKPATFAEFCHDYSGELKPGVVSVSERDPWGNPVIR